MENNREGDEAVPDSDSGVEVKKARRSSEGDGDLAKVPNADNAHVAVNPLLVDLILDKIFSLIISPLQKTSSEDPKIKFPSKNKKVVAAVSKDVQNFRLVCKLWRDRVTSIFKKFRAPLVFGASTAEGEDEEEYDSDGFYYEDKGDYDEWEKRQLPNSKLQRFLNTMKDSTMIPVQTYVLCTPIFNIGSTQLVNEFFKICGPELVNLRVNAEYFSRAVYIEQEESGLLNLPKLTNLCVFVQYFDSMFVDSETCVDIGSLCGLILKSASNLQQIKLEYGKARYGGGSKIAALFNFIQGSMKRLAVDIPGLSDVYLKTMNEKKMKLEKCKLNSQLEEEMSCSEDVVRKFLEMQSETLKGLTWPTSRSSLLSRGFPKMEELVHLTLNGESAVPIAFPQTFPKLKILSLHSLSDVAAVELLSNTSSAPSVEELSLPERTTSIELVRKVAKVFPAVKKLYATGGGRSSLPNNPNILPEIFQYFSNIEELFITFGFWSQTQMDGDSILSGIPHEVCEQIRSNGNFDDINLLELQRNPSILQLTKLKKLFLTDCRKVTFTDLTALIFLKMESLEELNADRFKQMKNKSLKQLKEKLAVKGSGAYLCVPDFDFGFNLDDEEDEENGSDLDSEWETDPSIEDGWSEDEWSVGEWSEGEGSENENEGSEAEGSEGEASEGGEAEGNEDEGSEASEEGSEDDQGM